METTNLSVRKVALLVPTEDWRAVASLVLMAKTEGAKTSIPKWIIEAIRQRLERDVPPQ